MPKFGKGGKDVPVDVIHTITGKPYETKDPNDKKGFLDEPSRQALAATSSSLRYIVFGDEEKRKAQITKQHLLAVSYGMESRAVNSPISSEHTGGLFKSHLFSEDLLKKSPEFLLESAHVTDWAGRTFKGRITEEHPEGEGITAFQYAVWAKDFKMIEMMIKCLNEANISEEEREHIRVELLRQYEQVTILRGQGGGLTYTHTYERPNLDGKGIPQKDAAGNWDCETVTVVVQDENHFDLTPLIKAYEDYERNYKARSWSERDACWIKVIGAMQRLLPVHVLQRYCDPCTHFYPLTDKTFHSEFKRSPDFYDYLNSCYSRLFVSSLSSDYALMHPGDAAAWAREPGLMWVVDDLKAIRRLDEVSTNATKNIIGQLSQPRHSAAPSP